MEIILRKEALSKGLDRYFTGKFCKKGHLSERRSKCGSCFVCKKEYRESHKKEAREYKKVYNTSNRDKISEYNSSYYKDNEEFCKTKSHDYYYKNLNKVKELRSVYKKNNRAKFNALNAEYRSRKLAAVPQWLSELDVWLIDEIYELSRLRSELTQTIHHVDHIIPLKGELVCGLHVPTNLQIITALENISKHNKFINT